MIARYVNIEVWLEKYGREDIFEKCQRLAGSQERSD
jgi:hypothetical protein